jgi:thioredoxin reductase
MAAATTAAAWQASVLLIDAAESLGGNYYKPLPLSFSVSQMQQEDAKRFNALQEKVHTLSQTQVDILSNTQVWGIFQESDTSLAEKSPTYTLHLNPSRVVEAKSLIIATGVYDRSIPFPGWTLPGVMTPGAVQMLIKKQGLLPGKRAVVAGIGPLQIAVAATLADAGVEIVALLDPGAATEGLSRIPSAMWGQWAKMRELATYLSSLFKNRVPLSFRHNLFKAMGNLEDGVQQAVIGQVDADGFPIAGTENLLDVDLVCVAYGFMPSIALTLHLGCEHKFDSRIAAYIPCHNEHMRTSLNGVYVAGDITGAGGKTLAELQGKMAGISALETLNAIDSKQAELARAKLRSDITRENRFANWIWDRWSIKSGFWDMIDDETIVCRCEGVRATDIRQSCVDGARNLNGAKLRTRLGMGICQGRYCVTNASILMAQEVGCSVQDIGLQSVRPPIVPIQLKIIAEQND